MSCSSCSWFCYFYHDWWSIVLLDWHFLVTAHRIGFCVGKPLLQHTNWHLRWHFLVFVLVLLCCSTQGWHLLCWYCLVAAHKVGICVGIASLQHTRLAFALALPCHSTSTKDWHVSWYCLVLAHDWHLCWHILASWNPIQVPKPCTVASGNPGDLGTTITCM